MKKLFSLTVLVLLGQALSAQSFFQASLTPDIAVVEKGAQVEGVALNIWGENQVNGLDLGFVNGLTGSSSGLNIAFLGSYAENYKGVLWGGFFTRSTGTFVGWQAATVNINDLSFKGLQSGLVNIANRAEGVQLGFVNYAKDLYGVQIGAINVVESNEWFTNLPTDLAKGFPFVNWSF